MGTRSRTTEGPTGGSRICSDFDEFPFGIITLGNSALASLEQHAAEIRWPPPGGGEPDIEYALVARSGATQSVREATDGREDLQSFSIEDVTQSA